MTSHEQPHCLSSGHNHTHDITSHHITSHHITSHHITSHHITSHHITTTPQKHNQAPPKHHERLKAGAHKKNWFGLQTGWWPCARSKGKFSRWFIGFFYPVKLPLLACPGTLYRVPFWCSVGRIPEHLAIFGRENVSRSCVGVVAKRETGLERIVTTTHLRDCFEAVPVSSCCLAWSRPSCNPNIPALQVFSLVSGRDGTKYCPERCNTGCWPKPSD